jgi:crotonobetainyl-CoA:carnitine CoA-transferase CaiB-like acyl-CoA transferase
MPCGRSRDDKECLIIARLAGHSPQNTALHTMPAATLPRTEFSRGARMSALAGIKVLEFSRVLAGPWSGMTLADLGADVIKIEPLEGDDTRGYGPPFLGSGLLESGSETADNHDTHGVSAYFAACNRNKRSLALDLRHPDARPLIEALIRDADVMIENFRNGVAESLGIGYDDVRALNPRLIYCAISGYGRDGPGADRPGYDFAIQAQSGLMAITGPREGAASKVGVAIADITTGLNATIAILAALHARIRSGTGQRIDIALFDSQLQALANVASSVLYTGEDAHRYGNAHPSIVPYQTFAAADGEFALAVASDKLWRALCDLLGASQWRDDPRCATNAMRVRHRDWLIPQLASRFTHESVASWLERFQAVGIPAAPVNSVHGAVFGELANARGLRVDADGVPMLRSPLRLSETPIDTYRRPPQLNEHADEICAHYGFDAHALRMARAIR